MGDADEPGGEPLHVEAHRLLANGVDCLLCRCAAALARLAAHPHAPPFCAPVDTCAAARALEPRAASGLPSPLPPLCPAPLLRMGED